MVKTARWKITILIIMSMLVQLFVGVIPVLAEEPGDVPAAEPEFVPLLDVTLSPGETAGATSATVTGYVYGNLLVNVTEQEIATPRVGDKAPTAGDNLLAGYESGADITAGVAAGNYLQIYDVDLEDEGRIFAFYQAELTEEDIKEEETGEDIGEDAEEEPAGNRLGAGLMAEGVYTYIDENGETKSIEYNKVTKITPDTATLNDGWYIVEGNILRNGTITVYGNVHLILADASSLTVDGSQSENVVGIEVTNNNSLTIYAQSKGGNAGSLNAIGGAYAAGIGGGLRGSGGNITINGGTVTAIGGYAAAGIGGGDCGSGGNITINGGTITATGGDSAGIGGGRGGSGGNITINGGTVTARGNGGAGIGGGWLGDGGTITINGGTVTARGVDGGAGIGGGYDANGGTITINGGTVTARGVDGGPAKCGAGIGGGYDANGGTITINGGTVTARGGIDAAGIGGGFRGSGGYITINGGTVTATGGDFGAGIGGGWLGNGGTIIINNHPTVIATGGDGGTDIGNGEYGEGNTVIKRGEIGGNDLTYVRLEVRNLSPNNTYKVIFQEGEHVINNEGITGFFVDRPADNIYIYIDLNTTGQLIQIFPRDIQNNRITINSDDIYFVDPVAGFGNALDFSADSQSRIDVPFNNATRVWSRSDFTISMWIFPRENEPYQTLYRQYDLGWNKLVVWLRYIKSNDDEGYLYFGFETSDSGWQWVWDWNNGIPPSDITKIPVNRWTHVALTKSGRNVMLYADGIKYSEMILDDAHYSGYHPNNGKISIGGEPVDNQFFDGRMDEIQFWNTALTQDEIAAWMYRSIDYTHSKYDNLVYYYKLNQSSETTALDSKGSYNGTAVNITEGNWVASDVREWTVYAGETLNGCLVGSREWGSSTDGTNWNLTFEIVEQAKKGTATITGDNEFEYCTIDREQTGLDSFTYRVKRPDGRYSNTQTVNINIIPAPILQWPPNPGGPVSGGSDRRKKREETGFKILVNGKTETAATVTTTQEGDKTVTTVVIDDKIMEEKLAQEGNNAVVTIPVMSGADVVIGTLDGQTVKNMESKDAVLEIKTGQVTYTLPASQINIDAVLEQIGKQAELKDIAVSVKISEPAADTVKIVEDTANKNNYQIIVKPIEFEITCSYGSKTVEVSKFNAYVERLIAIPEGVNPSKITTGVVLNPDGTFSHVPTAITMIDGKYRAKINSLTNSTYSVIYSPKTFKDVENHWAQKDIKDMASRLIISGVGDDLFEPERSITRAEFAAVMVRALGLRPEEYKNNFADVKAGEWYSEYISTSSYYGLVRGYDDGTFKPEGNITRQEAMAILTRAMGVTKPGEELEIDVRDILAAFSDDADVSGWAKDSVAKCVKTGVVTGKDNGQIAPFDNITRAETASMVRRLLINSDLINQ